MSHFKTAVGKVVREDHLVSTMPRIRISAAKSYSQGPPGLASSAARIMFPSSTNSSMQGGLTSSNLAQAAGEAKFSGMPSLKGSPEVARKATQRSSLMNPGGASTVRFVAGEVPSVHHRFNKDSVHLRSMYRQLYPTRNSKGFTMNSGANNRLDDEESNDGESRARSQVKKPTLV